MHSELKSATQIYVNPIHFEMYANIENWPFFAYQNWWNRKNCPKFFHRVIFAFWIQICNPNLCKSHIFWITANIEKWSFFAYPDLMTKIDEIEKIALWIQICNPKFFHRVIFAFMIFKSATQITGKSQIFWITGNI